MEPALRPMRPDDAPAVAGVAAAAFEDLARRRGEDPTPAPGPEIIDRRLRHVAAGDPDGAWVAESPAGLCGAGMALVREGLWGLSLLVVHPAVQSAGLGRALLDRTLATAAGTRGQIILSSSDPRAIRAYARAGFDLHPAVIARGRPRPLVRPPGVRRGGLEDMPLTVAVDRFVRGAAHEADIVLMLKSGFTLEVVDDRGYAVHREGALRLLAATDDTAAADLLRAVFASTPPGAEATADPLTAKQQWAVGPALEAGLDLEPWGPVFLRGDVGPFASHVPSGAYL